ncbi:EAL domain-containing protein [Ponticaulis sp.]|uniref:EAL domain-containing protein n=1 Tax=Ponticaulis sp. TaxID=2020902 RepID=UPI000B7677F9|nr:EAL domain-containing protein [Ponticaulis sp.]MAJ09961.1 diguanylate phosphodiesterase [Ponticaulis sp.]|tara:strand:- start:29383 stop:30642 length:1260 start_codon:yes stop_codon:yes gene_type:complete
MPAIAHILIAASYIVVGVFLGVSVFQFTTYSIEMSMISGLAAILASGLVHVMSVSRERAKQLEDRILSMRNDVRKANRKSEILEARLGVMEETLNREVSDRRETLVSEMRQLEGLIQQLGKSFETRLATAKKSGGSASSGTGEPGNRSPEQALQAVQDALDSNRVDLHLQPIVSLPQRRVCFYEGFTRLRDENDELIMPGEFLGAAKEAGLLGVIDNMLLFRCVQIVRRLSEKDRRVGVFCNVAMSSLEDESFFPQFLEFIKENRDLAGSLIFEISARDFARRSAVAARHMGRLTDLGFRFSLDKADDIAVNLPEMQAEHVKFLKVEGRKLLDQLVDGGPRPISSVNRNISPEDVPAVFMRYGVDLIAEKVEAEKDVVEILDFDIPFGQGHIFGEPRPIKGTLMEETAPPSEFMHRAIG